MTIYKMLGIAAIVMAMAVVSCGNGTRKPNSAPSGQDQSEQSTKPMQYTYKVINTYPHSMTSYTQGLFWYGGQLYESTGQYGESRMIRTELETGKALKSRELGPLYFGEGSVRLGDRIYVLTWKEQRAFVLDAATFKPIKEFRYKGEGWGITTDGEKLYMSDGTDAIRVLDPDTFETESIITVKAGPNRLRYINELEWVDGEIWANVYMSDFIVRIDPATGNVTGVIDLTGILPQSDIKAETDVLNGIAFDKENNRIFVTGKNWGKLFEIEVLPKE